MLKTEPIKNRVDEDLNLIVYEILTNSGNLLNPTIEEISRKTQARRKELENLFKKLQKRGLLFISHGRFCLTSKGFLFILNLLKRQGGEDNGQGKSE